MLVASGIKGGGVKSYCKTRWTTSSESVDSIIRLKPIFEEVYTWISLKHLFVSLY